MANHQSIPNLPNRNISSRPGAYIHAPDKYPHRPTAAASVVPPSSTNERPFASKAQAKQQQDNVKQKRGALQSIINASPANKRLPVKKRLLRKQPRPVLPLARRRVVVASKQVNKTPPRHPTQVQESTQIMARPRHFLYSPVKIKPQPPCKQSRFEAAGTPPAQKMTKQSFPKLTDAIWEDLFQRLEAFQASHSHCRVPKRYKPDPMLSQWVRKLRKQRVACELSSQRIARLDSLGFSWTNQTPQWLKRFEELKQFQQIHGHCFVTCSNPQLAAWVTSQRAGKKWVELVRKENPNYEIGVDWSERFALLEEIGFCWHGIKLM